jgi:hypothetical protein
MTPAEIYAQVALVNTLIKHPAIDELLNYIQKQEAEIIDLKQQLSKKQMCENCYCCDKKIWLKIF